MKNFRQIFALSFAFLILAEARSKDEIKTATPTEDSAPENIGKSLARNTDEIKTVASNEEKNNNNSIGEQIGKKLSEIISEIEAFCPQFIEKRQEFYSNGLKGFLKQLNPALDYVADEAGLPPRNNIHPPKFHKPIIIGPHRILYIRIDGFSEENFISLKEECVDISRLSSPPIGAILDLRSSSGENEMIAAEYASIFFDNEAISFVNNAKRGIISLPMAILIGGKTTGNPEIFTALLMKSGKALLVGEKSAGAPFAKFPIKLDTGGVLLLPKIPAELTWIKTSPLKPSINVRSYPQIEYSLISGTTGSEEADECVRRMSDLLVSLNAIHKKK